MRDEGTQKVIITGCMAFTSAVWVTPAIARAPARAGSPTRRRYHADRYGDM
jgi:hypothetical protein